MLFSASGRQLLRPALRPTLGTRAVRYGVDSGVLLDLKFAIDKSLDNRITFTRASTATYFDASGVLQTSSSGAARFDHLSVSPFTSLGLLMEEARTWRALWNRDFTNAAWVKSNISAAKDATGLDEASNSASTLTATNANGTCLQTVTLSSLARTVSFYVKRKTGTGDIDITDDNGSNWTTLTGLSASDWTRHDIQRTQTNPVFGFRIVTDTDAIEVDFAGLEDGGFATSAVATTTASVVRATDLATITDMSWLNVLAGTVLATASTPYTTTKNSVVWSISDGTTTNRIIHFAGGGGKANFFCADNGNTQANFNATGVWTGGNVTVKLAEAWENNDFIMYEGGSQAGTPDTSGTIPTGLDVFKIGRGSNNILPWNGHIARLEYFNTRRPNSELASITA